MCSMKRIISTYIFDPEMTAGKMIFLSGPRQVGKTTFGQMWLKSTGVDGTYFNWDNPEVMVGYRKNPLHFHNIIDEKFKNNPVPMVFDEIHRHPGWSDILKGIYDSRKEKIKLLVTGSGKIDLFLKSGDSLLGRHFTYRMFPLGLPEVLRNFTCVLSDTSTASPVDIFADGGKLAGVARKADFKEAAEGVDLLLKFGGFPEPFLKGSEKYLRRWHKDYRTLIAKEEVRDLSRVQDIKGIETLVELLPTRVGSNLSIPSISEDLGKKYDTINLWITILENLQLVFTVRPWHRNIARAIKKERKIYFYDWSILDDAGKRLENLVAISLVRMATRFTETGLGDYNICYIRDKEKREVDFILIRDKIPVALFETKEGGRDISRNGHYYANKLGIPFYQIVHKAEKIEEFPGNCFIIPAKNFLMLTG